jgi:hypothetical protein
MGVIRFFHGPQVAAARSRMSSDEEGAARGHTCGAHCRCHAPHLDSPDRETPGPVSAMLATA